MSLTINNLNDNSLNHYEDIKSLVIDEFSDSENLLRLLSSISNIKQEIEHVALDLMNKRTLALSEGAQLDGLGELVGLSREGRSDNEYRIEIGIQIQINLSGGQIEILIGVVSSLTGSTIVQLIESYPAKISISFDGTAPPNLIEVINRLKSSGVELTLSQISPNPFVFEGDISGLGFSDDGFLNGGELSEVI